MSLNEAESQLIKRIYSAGNDPHQWDAVVCDFMQLMGCSAGVATLVESRRGELVASRVYTPNGTDLPQAVEEYSRRFQTDPTLPWASANSAARCCDSRHMLPQAEYLSDPFVKWATAYFGSTHWFFAFTTSSDGLTFALAAHFPAQAADKGEEPIDRFRMLFDHIECAQHMGRSPFSANSFRPMLRVDRARNVQHVTKSAENFLQDGAGFRLLDGRLVALCRPDQERLNVAIDRALGGVLSLGNPTAVHVSVDTDRPRIMVVRPVAENYGPFGQVRRQVDIEILAGIPTMGRMDIIQSCFNLTAREMQVLRLLGNGHSIDSLSETINVSRNTTRNHLRAIFEKTRTNSQLELAQLCAGLTQATTLPQMEMA